MISHVGSSTPWDFSRAQNCLNPFIKLPLANCVLCMWNINELTIGMFGLLLRCVLSYKYVIIPKFLLTENYSKHFQSITFQIGEYPIYGYHSWRISYSLCAHFKLLVYLTYSCLFINLSGILFIKVGTAFAVFCWNLQVNTQWICQERTCPNYWVPYSDYPRQSCSLGSPWTPNIKMQF